MAAALQQLSVVPGPQDKLTITQVRETLVNPETGSEYSGNFVYELSWIQVPTLPQERYWHILDTTTDPKEYVRYLALWRTTDLNLFGQWVNFPGGSAHLFEANPEDISRYKEYVARFSELALMKAIETGFTELKMMQQPDKNAVGTALSFVQSRILVVQGVIDTKPLITISDASGRQLYTANGSIPSFESALTKPNTLLISLKDQYKQAMAILVYQHEKLSAWMAALMDKEKELQLSEYMKDPYFNLFLVWTGLKDKYGMPTFQDVGYRDAPGKITTVAATYGPTAKNYESVPLIQAYISRNIDIGSGATISRFDLEKRGLLKEDSNITGLLLLAGGIAAAAIASRYA
jgi:hypothetical protein